MPELVGRRGVVAPFARFARSVELPLGRLSEHQHHVCCNAGALVFSAQTFDPSNFASRSVRTARFVGVREATLLAYAKDDGQRPTHSVIDSDHECKQVWQFVRGVLRETGMQPHPLHSQRGCNRVRTDAAILFTPTWWSLMLLNEREAATSTAGWGSQRDKSRRGS
jgi:hypothetical protein